MGRVTARRRRASITFSLLISDDRAHEELTSWNSTVMLTGVVTAIIGMYALKLNEADSSVAIIGGYRQRSIRR